MAKKGFSRSRKLFGFSLLIPTLTFLFLTTIIPTYFLWKWSFLEYVLYRPLDIHWNWFQNYIHAFTKDPAFYKALGITLLYVSMALIFEISLGMVVALQLNRDLPGSRLMSALMIAPMVIPPIVVGLMWRMMYWETSGVINGILEYIGLSPLPWLGDTRTALLSLIITDTWQWMPFVALVLLTGLRGLPKDPLEAAKIDGASSWQSFFKVILPLLRPILVIIVLLRVIWILREFDLIYMMTSGGPGDSTRTLSFYIYQNGMVWLKTGYAAALSIILLNLAVFLAGRFLRFFPKEKEEI
jgi:multiple sugar transport system permease protein